MTQMQHGKRLGFFTRLLDRVPAAERYRLATEQIIHAERCGFDSAWIAQHHFHEMEGGLPAPLVFFGHVGARTSRIRLGTGIITLPMELPIRVAEDTAVLDMMCDGRLDVGVGPGGNPAAFPSFGLDSADRGRLFNENLAILRNAWTGGRLVGGDTLYPTRPELDARVWQATFSVEGGRRAGAVGDGVMLSRTQPRTAEAPDASLSDIQNPIIDAYLAALPAGVAPRIVASRSVIVADDREEMLRFATIGLERMRGKLDGREIASTATTVHDLIRAFDVHIGTPDEVIASLKTDTAMLRATDLVVQVHSVDPPHPYILRSIELMAEHVAPAFGWSPATLQAA